MKYSLPGAQVLSLTMKTAYFTPECPVWVFCWLVIDSSAVLCWLGSASFTIRSLHDGANTRLLMERTQLFIRAPLELRSHSYTSLLHEELTRGG